MSSLSAEIEGVRAELAQSSLALATEVQAIDEEAANRRRAAIAKADMVKGELSLRLAKLIIAQSMLGVEQDPAEAARQAAVMTGPRPGSSTDTILRVLASSGSSLPPGTLLDAVVASGLKRTAGEKALSRMVASGQVERNDGRYTITSEGRERMSRG